MYSTFYNARMTEAFQSENYLTATATVDRLFEVGESAYLLLPYIQCLAVTREDYARRYNLLEDGGSNEVADDLLETIDNPDFDVPTHTRDQVQKRAELTATYLTIAERLEADPHCRPDGRLDWRKLTFGLLDQTIQEQTAPYSDEDPGVDADNMMRAALACSLLSDDLELRRDFLRSVYAAELQNQLERLTYHTRLSLVIGAGDDITVKRFNNYSGAFKASREDVELYLSYTTEEQRHSKPAARKRQREVSAAYKEGNVESEMVAAAIEDSRAPSGEQHSRIDPYKIERFALQDMFLTDQLKALFPHDDIHDSPFASLLAYKHSNPDSTTGQIANDPFLKLFSDVSNAFNHLSQPVIDLYNLSNREDAEGPLTIKQYASKRFQQIIQSTINMRQIARYVDFENTILPFPNRDIWSIAENGADGGNQTHVLLSHVVSQAIRYRRETGNRLSPEALRDGIQERRKYLTRVAMININDFSMLTMRGDFSNVPIDMLGKDRNNMGWQVNREDDGTAGIYIPLAHKKTHGLVRHYDGATLGCPAGRIGRDGTKQQNRGTHATNNLIDYIAEITIDEAYNRGILDLDRYMK
jgi:hypothetical protein